MYSFFFDNRLHTVKCHRAGNDAAIVTYGRMLDHALDAAELLTEQGIEVSVIRLLHAAPLPVDAVLNAIGGCRKVVIVEETAAGSGIRHELAAALREKIPGLEIGGMDLGSEFVTHGSVQELYKAYHLDGKSIAEYTKGVLQR